MYSIGIIAVAASMKNIMEIDEDLQKHCNVTYLPYTSNDHLMYVYQQNVGRFDALLFGGEYTWNIIQERSGNIPIPFAFFDVADRDYYRVIAQLAIQEPGLDFARVLFDKPETPVNFPVIFGRSDIPLIIDDFDCSLPYSDYWALELNCYQKLWADGQVDWIVTRFGSMEEELQRLGIRYKLLLPSKESMLDTFFGLLLQLEQAAPREGTVCIGLFTPNSSSRDTDQLDRLEDCICDYNRRMGDIFLLYRHGSRLEVTTSLTVLREMTRDYTSCPLLANLERALSFPVSIGWGYAENVIAAHQNAVRALRKAARQSGPSAYLVTDDGYIVGPLGSGPEQEITSLPHLHPAEESCHIASDHQSKLRAALAKRDDPVLCAKELAGILDITTRSAARILLQLEKSGAARAYEKRSLNQRGRPTKYYQIDPTVLIT